MRRAGLSLTLALSAFAAAENVVPAVPAVISATALEGKAADVKTAAQNILIKTENVVPSGAKIGTDDKPLAFKVSKTAAGEDAVVLVVSNLKVAAAKLDEAMPEASLGCFTIGDDVGKVALLMCNGKDAEDAETATPIKKDGVVYEWVKGVITNEGPEAICQLNFASVDTELAKIPNLETLPAELSELTSFKLEPKQKMDYAFLLPVDAEKGVPTIGVMDSLGPCEMIEKAKAALAAGASDTLATATGVAEDAAALSKKSLEEAAAAAAAAKAAGQGALDATKAAAGDAADATKAAAEEAADATKAAAEEAANATKTAAEEAADATKAAAGEAADATVKAGEVVPAVETEAAGVAAETAVKAEGEVTSPAPKMSASVMGLFTVAVLVAVQLLL